MNTPNKALEELVKQLADMKNYPKEVNASPSPNQGQSQSTVTSTVPLPYKFNPNKPAGELTAREYFLGMILQGRLANGLRSISEGIAITDELMKMLEEENER